jgi:hypothetical protein
MDAKVCDRCSRVILPEDEQEATKLSLTLMHPYQPGVPLPEVAEILQNISGWDLCPKCTAYVDGYIRDRIMLDKEPKKKTAAPSKPKRPKPSEEDAKKLQKAAEAGA